MNCKLSLVTLLLLGTLNAQADVTKTAENNSTKTEKCKGAEDPETKALELKEKKLSLANSLLETKLRSEHATLLTKLQKLRWEKELLEEQFSLKELEAKNKNYETTLAQEEKINALEYTAKLKALKNDEQTQILALEKAKLDAKVTQLEAEVSFIENAKKREKYVTTEPLYLDKPLTSENQLVISDRKILIHGIINKYTAKEVSQKIDYFNNKDNTKPIFIVIDFSPGGSTMSGYLILKAMKGSKSPVYVVLKEFAASMAAVIVTLADKSFAYSHATLLHHQPWTITFGNIREQEEQLENLKSWWREFGEPVAHKMGIGLEEFKEEMYKHSARGNWRELAVDAQKLNWVDTIVDTIVDTSILEEPKREEPKERRLFALLDASEQMDENGKPVVYLPRLSAVDAYFVFNPDGYYQMR